MFVSGRFHRPAKMASSFQQNWRGPTRHFRMRYPVRLQPMAWSRNRITLDRTDEEQVEQICAAY